MKIFDAHCDTIEKLLEPEISLYKNSCHCDLKRMQQFDAFLQVFACCVYPNKLGNDAFLHANKMIDVFQQHIVENADSICLCTTFQEMSRIMEKGEIGGILALEGGSPLNGKLENIDHFFKRGVRIITLTWNHRNELGTGALTANNEGLTAFGKQVVKRMHELGMIVDVSHLSDRGFYDVCACDSIPFIASHSNARAVCNHPRNLSDAMITEIINRKGMIGINLYPPFLTPKATADLEDILPHIEHILSLGGEDCIGLGCDFDGIAVTPSDICGIEDLYKLLNRLLQHNYSEEFLEKITHGNFMSFLHNYTQYIKIV